MSTLIQSTVEPVSLEMARLQCSIDSTGSPPASPWDALLELYIAQAREWCETYTGRTFAQRTIEYSIDEFPASNGDLSITGDPIVGLPEIRYTDSDGIEQLVDPSTYTLRTVSGYSYLRLVTDAAWPTDVDDGLIVRYTVGYSVPGESPDNNPLPPAVKGAILLLVGHWFKNREDTADVTSTTQVAQIPMGARALLDSYRIRRGFA